MTRRAAFVQADVERVIRAAKRQGAAGVTVKVGVAEIAVDLREPVKFRPLSTPAPVAPKRRIAL
jgi:hypothetical protein